MKNKLRVGRGRASASKRKREPERPPAPAPNPNTSSPRSPRLRRVLSIRSSSSPPPCSSSLSSEITDPNECHACRLKFDDKGNLRVLESLWRVVVLCSDCLVSITSGDICSYCFVPISVADDLFLNCQLCLRRVHWDCIPEDRRRISPFDEIDGAASFTCVDCRTVPIGLKWRPK